MHNQLKNQIQAYLLQFKSSEIKAQIEANAWPFFGRPEEDCIDLAWEIMAQRKLEK